MSVLRSPHLRAVLLALFVTFLWSTSWVLIKFGLHDIPALPFAGLRYSIAALCLLPLALRPRQVQALRHLSRGMWLRLAVLGLIFYAVTQGAQFLSLTYLPAMTTSLLLSFSPVVVALLGIVFLKEHPTRLQWSGSLLYLVGIVVYFHPLMLPESAVFGLIVALVGVLANALSAILGRDINRAGQLDPILVTIISMGIGALILLIAGIAVQGFPPLTLGNWLVIIWLALVNSALAFVLWNHSLRILSAMESSLINNTMLFQIAILAWIFLGERVTPQEGIGLLIAAAGVIVVQIRR